MKKILVAVLDFRIVSNLVYIRWFENLRMT